MKKGKQGGEKVKKQQDAYGPDGVLRRVWGGGEESESGIVDGRWSWRVSETTCKKRDEKDGWWGKERRFKKSEQECKERTERIC